MTEPSGRSREPSEQSGPDSPRQAGRRPGGAAGDSWEQRASGLASEIQRWLIRTSARSMRDELGGQVRKVLRGGEPERGDSWATATTEPPYAAQEAPECAWCPVCRAARRISQARSGTDGRGGPRLSDATDVMAAAVRDALSGLDAVLSYRPSAESGEPERAAEEASRDHGPRSADQPQPTGEPLPKKTRGNGPPAADPRPSGAGEPAADRMEEPEDEPDHRG